MSSTPVPSNRSLQLDKQIPIGLSRLPKPTRVRGGGEPDQLSHVAGRNRGSILGSAIEPAWRLPQ